LNVIKRVLNPYAQIAAQEILAYQSWAMFENIQRLKLFAWVGSSINIAIILLGANVYGTSDFATLESIFRFLWVIASLTFILCVGRVKNPDGVNETSRWLFFVAASLSLVFSMLITVTYDSDQGYTFLFIINFLLTSTLLYLTFFEIFCVAAPSFVIFFIAVFDSRLGHSLEIESIINIVAVSVFALAVSQMNFFSELAKFKLQRIVSEQNVELRSMAEIDELTGIANRRKINQYFSFVRTNAQRAGVPIALIMLDIDFFKAYNDTYGHPKGDQCLRDIVRIVTAVLQRRADFWGRYGGEEFLIILNDATEEDAQVLAEKILLAVFDADLHHQLVPLGRVTVSMGIAVQWPGEELTAEALISRADAAMYQAKENGRNCVHVFHQKDSKNGKS
jgi:diguanylate cyclase (GGDEF)-like protein